MRRTTTIGVEVLLSCAVVIQLQAATITVTNTNDSGPDSLRQALASDNNEDTINFAVTGTIGLTSGELLVDKSITIFGPGAAILAVDGNATNRVFHIGPGKTVSISNLTVTNGFAGSENGGGILNDHAILTIGSCAVQNSSAQSNRGGGIYNDGSAGSATLTITNSTVSVDSASFAGGGIYNDAGNGGDSTLTIMNSTIDDNSAAYNDIPFGGGEGGGIYNSGGMMTITNSRVNDNSAGLSGPNFPTGAGGGISNYGTLTITNSTISSNNCFLLAGGVYNNGTLTITNSTVSGNSAVANMMASHGATAAQL